MDSIKFPTFTIPTNKCCSMILPFADIASALGDRPHIVQVGVGELSKNFYQIEDLKINWLHSPIGWPVYVSGFNPGIHPHSPQVFQYDLNKKKIQVTSGSARESLSHDDMAKMVSVASNPEIHMVSFPCEEGDDVEDDSVIEPIAKKPKHEGKAKKLKRKQNRRHQSFIDSILAVKNLHQKIVCPIVTRDQDISAIADTEVFGCSGTMNHRSSHPELPGVRFVQIHHKESNESTLREIRNILESKSADVFETDFPFKLAREGFLLDSEWNLVDMKSKDKFNDHSDLLKISDDTAPESVREAAAHMRSYIHHLFRCDELSGPILLATVNLYQFESLFRRH